MYMTCMYVYGVAEHKHRMARYYLLQEPLGWLPMPDALRSGKRCMPDALRSEQHCGNIIRAGGGA